jgi:hypothetical protein
VHADRPEALDDEMDESEEPILPDIKIAPLPADPWVARELESAIKGISLYLMSKKMDSLSTMLSKWQN